MVTSYTWHQGADPVAPKWPIPVPLLPDELFSSWLVRAALSHGCDPMVLTRFIWPKWRLWCMDFDRGVHSTRLSKIAAEAGISEHLFGLTSLRSILTNITLLNLDNSTWPWLLALGSRNRHHHGGVQYCPLCLACDRVPYYRMDWRFAWHTVCAEHKVVLKDSCYKCGAPIIFHMLTISKPHLYACASCGVDLRAVNVSKAAPETLALQLSADTTVCKKQGNYSDQLMAAADWFLLLGYFIEIFQIASRSKSTKFVNFLERFDISGGDLFKSNTGLPFELLSVADRMRYMAAANKLMRCHVSYFYESAKLTGLNKSTLCGCNTIVPEIIHHSIHDLPEVRHHRRERTATIKLMPRSPSAVKAMLARLLRRL